MASLDDISDDTTGCTRSPFRVVGIADLGWMSVEVSSLSYGHFSCVLWRCWPTKVGSNKCQQWVSISCNWPFNSATKSWYPTAQRRRELSYWTHDKLVITSKKISVRASIILPNWAPIWPGTAYLNSLYVMSIHPS